MNTFEKFLDFLDNIPLQSILTTILILIAGLVFVKILSGTLTRFLGKTHRLDLSLQKFILRMINVVIYFILLIICAGNLGIPINSLLTILASMGLAVSLALQDSLKNVAGGIFLFSSKPFATGDYIELEGFSGTVYEIGIVYTILITSDNQRIFVPNRIMSGSTLTNFSSLEKRRLVLTFPVSCECDLALAKKVILDTVLSDARVLTEPEPLVRVWDLSSSSVDIALHMWCKTGEYWDVRSSLLEAVKTALDKADIYRPYDKLTVHLEGKE